MFGGDFIALDGAVALALKIFERCQREVGYSALPVVSAYSPMRHKSQGAQEQLPSRNATFNFGKRSMTPPKIMSPQASMLAKGKPKVLNIEKVEQM